MTPRGWNTAAQTLDPNLTAIALRGRAHPEAHYVQVRAWEARRRRQRWLANLGSGLVLAGALAGAVVLLAALAGCSVRYDRLPDPAPGVGRGGAVSTWLATTRLL